MKPFKNKLIATVLLLSVIFLTFIAISFNKDHTKLSGIVGKVIMPIQKVVYNVNSKLKDSMEFLGNFSDVKKENSVLINENAKLKGELATYKDMKEENDRLREILKFKDSRKNYDYMGCNIIGYSGGNFIEGYIIDRGSNDGITKDMVIINSEGLVGKVTEAESNYSIVQSILNENIAASVMVENAKEITGILRGVKENREKSLTKIYNLPIESNIKEGDVIMTSGLGLVYPKSIPVGKVVSVETDNVMVMKNAVVEPFVDFKELQELFVIIPKDKVNIKYEE